MFMSDIPVKYQHIPFADILRVAKEFEVCPYLITAIGWHETQWGKLGLGKQGFLTGYGAFDCGPDFSFAEPEIQIRGTAEIMREWGMRPGRVTLRDLKRGNRGEFGRIYARDPDWADKVWRHYQRIKQEIDLDGKTPDDFEVAKERDLLQQWRIQEHETLKQVLEQWGKHDFRPGFEERDIELGPTQQVVRILVIIMLIGFLMFTAGWAFKDEALKVIKTARNIRGG